MHTSSPDLGSRTLLSARQTLMATDNRVLVAAHRGVWSAAPENSIAAIRDAVDQGADIVEFDVRGTRDGVLVLLHDATVDRMSNGTGAIAEHDFVSTARFRLKARDGGAHALVSSEGLPTLASALEAARDRIIVNLDVKDAGLADLVARMVIASGMAHQVFVKADVTFPVEVGEWLAVSKRLPFVPMMRARPGKFAEDLRTLEALECPMYEVSFDSAGCLEEGREELARQGARLWVNTILASHSCDFNDVRALLQPDAVWGRLLEAGVGAIQTDRVAELIRYLDLNGRR